MNRDVNQELDSQAGSAPATRAASVTQVLNDAGGTEGTAAAAAALLPLVYDQLRRLAASHMRQQRPEHTLQATALVHEAYLRLVDEAGLRRWESRQHFFAAAAEAMRWILVDGARRRCRVKRGGVGLAAVGDVGIVNQRQRIPLDNLAAISPTAPEELLALDEALTALAEVHPDKAELVKLRYFAGLTIDETARTLGISTATAERRWAFSRAWMYSRIAGAGCDE